MILVYKESQRIGESW